MARVPEVQREGLSPDAQALYDEIASSRGSVRGPLAAMMNVPELARRCAHMGAYVRFEAELGDVERELAALAICAALDGEYPLEAHRRIAPHLGVREEAVEIAAGNDVVEGLTEEEATVVRFTRELAATNRVSDETFEAARAQLGERGVVELSAAIGYYAMLAYFMNALEVAVPDDPGWSPLAPQQRA